MFQWLRRRREEKLEKSGGLEEKKRALEKTNAVADEVIRKMEAIKADRRYHSVRFDGQDRRLGMV